MPSAFRPTRILTGMRAARKRKNRSAYRTPASFLGGNPSYRIWGSVNMEELYISISQTRSQPEFFISARPRTANHRTRIGSDPYSKFPRPQEASYREAGNKENPRAGTENIQPETQNYTEDESKQEKRTDDRRHGIDCVDDTGRPDGSGPRDRSRQDDLALCRQGNGQPLHGPLCGRSVPGNERALSDIRFRRRVRRRRARFNPAYVPYFEYFARKGYAVISIDYRLGLRETAGSRPDPADTPEALAERSSQRSIWPSEGSVRRHVLHRRTGPAWGLDPSAVVASGSSAGAITVLQGEYERCTGSALSRRLPEGFRYAGIIAFAGAVLEKGPSGPVWREKPAPIQLFHGDADCNVPYDSIGTGGAALYGSFYLSRQFRRMNTPFYFYSVSGAAHEMAVRPMDRNRAEIEIFLDRLVLGREPLMIETQVEPGSELRPHGKRSRFRTSSGPTREHRPNPLRLPDEKRRIRVRRTDCIDVRPAWSATKRIGTAVAQNRESAPPLSPAARPNNSRYRRPLKNVVYANRCDTVRR